MEIGSLQKTLFPTVVSNLSFLVKKHISVAHLFPSEKVSRIV